MKYFGIIYKAYNRINNKCYIGQTIQSLSVRKNRHINDSLYRNTNIYFHNAIKKHGSDNFDWEIIEFCDSKKELNEMEFHYIMQYDSLNNGYNLTLGGEGSFGYKHTFKNRKVMSAASFKSNNHCNRGKHLSEKWKQKIGLSNKGKIITKECRDKISKSKTGKFIGKDSKCSKKFVITDTDGYSFIIHGLANFARQYKNGLLDFRLLSAVARGKRRHHKGYKCRYFDNNKDKDLKFWQAENNKG